MFNGCEIVLICCAVQIAKKISIRAVTIIGGVVFIGFAIATLIFGMEADEEISVESLWFIDDGEKLENW